jgi:hypothetical protein
MARGDGAGRQLRQNGRRKPEPLRSRPVVRFFPGGPGPGRAEREKSRAGGRRET